VLTVNGAKKRTSTGLSDPKGELTGDSEIAYFSSFYDFYINNERP